MSDKISILLIESNQMTSRGILAVLQETIDFEVAAETASGVRGIELLQKFAPDIILMELRNSDLCGLDFVLLMREKSLQSKIIFLIEDVRDVELNRSLRLGATGFVMKNASETELIKAIRTVYQGKNYLPAEVSTILYENLGQEDLTPSEQRILEMIVEGDSNREIAEKLNVSENTVRTHVKSIFDKLAVTDRTSAVTTGIRRGLIRVDF